jgi:hypothetical protein
MGRGGACGAGDRAQKSICNTSPSEAHASTWDTTDVEVYGRKKQGVALKPSGPVGGPPAGGNLGRAETTLAADLGSGVDDPCATAVQLLKRALTGPPRRVRRERLALAPTAATSPQSWPAPPHRGHHVRNRRQTHRPVVAAAVRCRRGDWRAATDMTDAQVAVVGYAPREWPAGTRLLIRGVRLCRRHDDPRLLVHPHQPRRFQPRPGGRGRTLAPAPHQHRKHHPRQQTRRRAAPPAQSYAPLPGGTTCSPVG